MRLTEFSEKYFGVKNNWHHKLIYDALDGFVYQEKGKIYNNLKVSFHAQYHYQKYPEKSPKSFLFLVPRGHGKSTQVSVIYPIYLLCQNKNTRVLIVSASSDISKSFVRQILNIFETNEKLREDFSIYKPALLSGKKWGEKALLIDRDSFEKDPSVTAAGLMERIVSKRADVIILDDLIDLDRARTKEAREKTFEWFTNVLYPILEEGGKLVVVGTKWFNGDFYDQIEKETKFDFKLKLKAFIHKTKTPKKRRPLDKLSLNVSELFGNISVMRSYNIPDDLVLWKERMDEKALLKKKELMGESAFYRQYLNEPVSEKENLFKKKYVDMAFDNGYLIPTGYDEREERVLNSNLPNGKYLTVMGVDLAVSFNRRSDYSAISIVALWEKTGKRFLFHLSKMRASMDEVRQRAISLYHQFSCKKMIVESNVFQQLFVEAMKEEEGVEVEGFKTTSLSKLDQRMGLSHLAVLLEQGNFIIPSRPRNKNILDFYQELLQTTYEGHTPDTVMAVWFALRKIADFDLLIKKSAGFLSSYSLSKQYQKSITPNRILIAKGRLVYSTQSIVHCFLKGKNPDEIKNKLSEIDVFVGVSFFKKLNAVFLDKKTGNLVLRISAPISLGFAADLIENYTLLFKSHQIAVLKEETGQSLFSILSNKNLNLYHLVPKEQTVALRRGFTSLDVDLALSFEEVRRLIEQENYYLLDDKIISQFSSISTIVGKEVIAKEEDIELAKIFAYTFLLWWVNRVEGEEKQEKKEDNKILIVDKPHYTIFNY